MITIRRVKHKNLTEIMRLERNIFKENAFSKDLLEKLIRKSYLFLKLELGCIKKKIIGFAIVLKDMADRANLINILIRSNYHRKGYGSYLLRNIINRIEKNTQIKLVVLNVNINNLGAIHLYEQFGFEIIKKIDNYYHTGDDAYLMALNLQRVTK